MELCGTYKENKCLKKGKESESALAMLFVTTTWPSIKRGSDMIFGI